MPCPPPGPARNTRAAPPPRGFTLLEILVVIVILGVIVSVATVAVGALGRDRELEDEARRLAAVMTQAREESELQGRDIGVFLDHESYAFMVFEPQVPGWVMVEDDTLLSRRELPPGLRQRLWLESREVVLTPPRLRDEDDERQRLPQVILLASGEATPFRMELEREGGESAWVVQTQPDNSLVVAPAEGR